MRIFRFDQFTSQELKRMLWLRAVEWLAWPAFLSQPILPLLYVVYPVYKALLLVALAGLVWLPFRYQYASLQLATLGCLWAKLKWVTIPCGVMLLLFQKRFIAALFALATTPIVSFLVFPGKIGVVELKFYLQSGVELD